MTAACEIVRLPEDLVSVIISLTSPLDACRAAAVSRAFCAAADSEAVWSRFLPTELSLVTTPASKKARFMRLSDHPTLLPCELMSVWLDKATGGKCYSLSARALHILCGDDPGYWRWIHVDVPLDIETGTSTSLEAAQLMLVFRLEIRGKIQRKMLSKRSIYVAYMVFKLLDRHAGLSHPYQQEAFVRRERRKSTHRACLGGYDDDAAAGGAVPWRQVWGAFQDGIRRRDPIDPNMVLPRRRADGWMELELGWFYNKEDGEGEVCFGLTETECPIPKIGLVVRSIEVRIKK
ncbi:unnamed protein product [Alopecurus aequalis]